jgi:CRISPR/Cas system-associated exonuclease Cas4 (RecB family)
VSEATEAHVIAFGNENGELYEHRVARLTLDEPEKYFQRRPLVRLESELVEYADELWEMAHEILATRRRVTETRLPVRSSGSCMNYGRACEYLGICSGHDSPDSPKWQRRESVHSELSTVGDGRDVLTNSRLKVFQACKRKHYYRYELGIERTDRETSDALAFGSTMHAGLECWWARFPAHQPTGETNDVHA